MFTGSNVNNKTVKAMSKEAFESVINGKLLMQLDEKQEKYREQKLNGEISANKYKQLLCTNKRRRPYITTSDFSDGIRRNDSALWAGLGSLDIDHIGEDVKGFYDHNIKGKEEDLGIVLAFISPSGEGLKLLFLRPEEISSAEAQCAMAGAIGTAYDSCTKDMARATFLVSKKRFIYMDTEKLFNAKKFAPKQKDLMEKLVKDYPLSKALPLREAKEKKAAFAAASEGYNLNVVATKKTMMLIEAAMEEKGITKEMLNYQGARHGMLTTLLSSGIYQFVEKEQLVAALAQLTPDYSKEEDFLPLIDWHYAKTRMPYIRQSFTNKIIHILSLNDDGTDPSSAEDANDENNDDKKEFQKSPGFTMKTSEMPIGIKESLKNVEDDKRMAVLFSILPVMATYADQVSFKYADCKTHYLRLMSVVVGEFASGKGICEDYANAWSEKMRSDDKANRKIQQEWYEKVEDGTAKGKKEERPHVVVRYVSSSITRKDLFVKLQDANGHTLYSFAQEIDTMALGNKNDWGDKYDIYRSSFDNSYIDRDSSTDKSMNGVTRAAYNFSATGTHEQLFNSFASYDNIKNGTASRLMITELVSNPWAELPHLVPISEATKAKIAEAIDILEKQKGFIELPKLAKEIEEWVNEKAMFAYEINDKTYSQCKNRAAVIGFRAGVIFYILEQKKFVSKKCVNFAKMVAEEVLFCQYKLFAPIMKMEHKKYASHVPTSTKSSILNSLPEVFTKDDVIKARGGKLSGSAFRTNKSRWIKTGKIEELPDGKFKKIG